MSRRRRSPRFLVRWLRLLREAPGCLSLRSKPLLGEREEGDPAAGEEIQEGTTGEPEKRRCVAGREAPLPEEVHHRVLLEAREELLLPELLVEDLVRDVPLEPELSRHASLSSVKAPWPENPAGSPSRGTRGTNREYGGQGRN